MRNIFLEIHTQNVLEKLFPDPFLKNQNWASVWIKSLKFYTVCFYYITSWGPSKFIETKLLQATCFDFIEIFFKKQRGQVLVCLPQFLHDFWRKIFLFLYPNTWPNFIVWLPLDIMPCVYCNCLLIRLWRENFWNQFYLSNQAVFQHDQKVKTKI